MDETSNRGISRGHALAVLRGDDEAALEYAAAANRVRCESRGPVVALCSIVNARSGACGEDCAFCAQSSHSRASAPVYDLLAPEAILDAGLAMEERGATRFSVVTSGRSVDSRGDVRAVAAAVELIRNRTKLTPCASLGIVSLATLRTLRDAGLDRYHHNLESARSFYPAVCTTRAWSDSVHVLQDAMEAGLTTCCGGILGLGESLDQRVELLAEIRDLDPDSVPLNFLHPIPGTRAEALAELTPMDCVRAVAAARLMMPAKEIRLCGGREYNLGQLQPLALLAGADGLMVGDYLTTSGRRVEDDIGMIRDVGLVPGS